ncbi:MAG: AAA family ATPase [Caldisericia bacterium]|jgi:DNA repair exonuclease SbcCD ATPase subunit|nr:AAA family ATPase [Caldisericia bacterium]
MHIKEIVIKNFQSHKYTKITLSDKINVFLGKGNSGKSAIIRALIWVFFNEPQGTSFIRKNEQSAFVSITLDSGFKVIRERGVNINKYILITPEGEKKEFSNFGREVPEEIRKVLGIKTLPLENGKKLNPQIKDQIENIYLLDEPPSTIHSTLLTISGGQVFDEAINSILVDLQRLDRREKDIKKEIDEKNNLLKNFEGIDEKKEELVKIKNEIDVFKKIQEKKNIFEKLKLELENIKKEKEEIELNINSLKRVELIEKESDSLNSKKDKLINLIDLNQKIEKVREEINKISHDLNLLKKSNLSEDLSFELKIKNEKLNNLKNLKVNLLRVKNDIFNLEKESKEIEKKIIEDKNLYVALILNSKVCPICTREIDENMKEKIKENLNKMWR